MPANENKRRRTDSWLAYDSPEDKRNPGESRGGLPPREHSIHRQAFPCGTWDCNLLPAHFSSAEMDTQKQSLGK